jgi:hypothetical protein
MRIRNSACTNKYVHINMHAQTEKREEENQCKAILMGVVRQDVNTSAGNSAL